VFLIDFQNMLNRLLNWRKWCSL